MTMAEATNQTTIIGADTHINGEMTFDGTARILGKFEGKIAAKGELFVADGASCKAAVEAGKVTVDGVVEGNVTARERVELTAKARMRGDLVAARLLVAEGASFVGHCTVGPEAVKGGKLGEAGGTLAEPKPGAVGTGASGNGAGRPEPAVRR
jgi:cytoskeletal protein CcmA (bactofilin family)